MKRYINSLFISVVLYSTLFASVFYFLGDVEFSKKDAQVIKESRMKVSLLAMATPKVLKKQVHKKKSIPNREKTSPKIKPRKIVKKIATKRKKVCVKKRVIQKQKVLPQRVQKINKEVAVDIQRVEKTNKDKAKEKEELLRKQNVFFAQLKEAINSNKTYPQTARRRNVQGAVKVKFFILASGEVQKIELIQGHSIFKRSVHEAIEKSFPITVEKELFSFPKEFRITLNYILR